MNTRAIRCLLLLIIGICAGCANITTPTGGRRDKTPPKLVSISPADSLKNTRVKRIEMYFNEYITSGDVSREVHISPMIDIDPTVTSLNKHVIVKIVDSLLDSNTTYRISFGNAIKDLHEGNAFTGYTYTFSTGSYFDSLELKGSVINAATGLPDTGNVIVVLYSGRDGDSAVVRRKPKYITRTDNKGAFIFKGLPPRSFRLYAIKDANNNLMYNGPEAAELIAFTEKAIFPGDTSIGPVNLRLFAEIPDSTATKKLDSLNKKDRFARKKEKTEADNLTYSVSIDTSNVERRTYDITHPINILFSSLPALNADKIKLSYDSSGITVDRGITIDKDPKNPNLLLINTNWSLDKVYTLRLAKGFAKDTAGTDVMPARYTFRTLDEDDYGKVTLNFPAKYNDPKYILVAVADKDTVYHKPISGLTKNLNRLRPAKYTFCIIVDKNGNGKWDTGDLFAKIQPEEVIPYRGEVLIVRPGFEYIIDFEQKPSTQDNKFKNR